MCLSHVTACQLQLAVSDCDPVVLAEDAMMAGFIPMLSAPLESSFVHSATDKVVILWYL